MVLTDGQDKAEISASTGRPRPGYVNGSSTERAQRSYTRRDMLVGASALAVLAGGIYGFSSGGSVASTPPAKTAPPPAPLALRSSPLDARQEFVDQAVARYRFADPEPVKVLKIGNDICGMLSTGSPVDEIAAVTRADSRLSPADANSLVNLAVQDLCAGFVPRSSPAAP